MKDIINPLRKLSIYAFYPRQILDSGPSHALQAAKLLQEQPPPTGADTRNLFQRRGILCFSAALPVTRQRKTMSLIADLLNQMQCWRVCG